MSKLKKNISLLLCLTLWSCKTIQSLPQASETFPVREIIHAVLDYQYSRSGLLDPSSDQVKSNEKNQYPQIDQSIHYWDQFYIDRLNELENGMWEDHPTLYSDSTMVVDLGEHSFKTKSGHTVFFKKKENMKADGYISFSPPSWDVERKRFCGFMKLSYGEVHLYAVEKKGEQYECVYTVFYHS